MTARSKKTGTVFEIGRRYEFDPSYGRLMRPYDYKPGVIEVIGIAGKDGSERIRYRIVHGVKEKVYERILSFSVGSNFETCLIYYADDESLDEIETSGALENFLISFKTWMV